MVKLRQFLRRSETGSDNTEAVLPAPSPSPSPSPPPLMKDTRNFGRDQPVRSTRNSNVLYEEKEGTPTRKTRKPVQRSRKVLTKRRRQLITAYLNKALENPRQFHGAAGIKILKQNLLTELRCLSGGGNKAKGRIGRRDVDRWLKQFAAMMNTFSQLKETQAQPQPGPSSAISRSSVISGPTYAVAGPSILSGPTYAIAGSSIVSGPSSIVSGSPSIVSGPPTFATGPPTVVTGPPTVVIRLPTFVPPPTFVTGLPNFVIRPPTFVTPPPPTFVTGRPSVVTEAPSVANEPPSDVDGPISVAKNEISFKQTGSAAQTAPQALAGLSAIESEPESRPSSSTGSRSPMDPLVSFRNTPVDHVIDKLEDRSNTLTTTSDLSSSDSLMILVDVTDDEEEGLHAPSPHPPGRQTTVEYAEGNPGIDEWEEEREQMTTFYSKVERNVTCLRNDYRALMNGRQRAQINLQVYCCLLNAFHAFVQINMNPNTDPHFFQREYYH